MRAGADAWPVGAALAVGDRVVWAAAVAGESPLADAERAFEVLAEGLRVSLRP